MPVTDVNDVCTPLRFVATQWRKTNHPSIARSAALKLEE
jgi:hypothetical protein